jgi:hypothetical protein
MQEAQLMAGVDGTVYCGVAGESRRAQLARSGVRHRQRIRTSDVADRDVSPAT